MLDLNNKEWKDKAEELKSTARKCIEQKDLVGAEDAFKEALKFDYYNGDFRDELKKFYEELDRHVEAERVSYRPYNPDSPLQLKWLAQKDYKLSDESLNFVKAQGLEPKYDLNNSKTIEIKKPVNWETMASFVKKHQSFKRIGTKEELFSPALRCYEQARLSCNGAFVTGNLDYLKENRVNSGSFLRYVFFHPLAGFLIDKNQPPKKCCDLGFVFQRHPMLNYYHLLIEQIPALIQYKECLEKKGVKLIVMKNNYYDLIKQFISMLDIKEDSILVVDEPYVSSNYLYKQDAAINDKNSIGFLTTSTVSLFNFLKNKFKKASGIKRRIFISREDSPKRCMTNEQDVIEILDKYGFEKVVLTGMTIKEQVELFSNCEAVVAAHGAGLTNIGFCQEDTLVVEITRTFTLSRVNIFWDLAIVNNLDYAIICKDDAVKDHAAPFEAPLDELERLISSKFF